MMHLNDSELVDLVENMLAPERQRHAAGCEACQAKAGALRQTLVMAVDADVPEPSPLFWDHFGARVREAVREAGEPTRVPFVGGMIPVSWPNGRESLLRWVEAVAVLILVAALGIWALVGPRSTPAADGGQGAVVSGTAAVETATDAWLAGDDVEADEAWSLVQTIADDASWDDTLAAGINARPGSADRAALQLTREERSELMRLLAAEMKRPGA